MDITTDIDETKLTKWFKSIEKSGSVRINAQGLDIRPFKYQWKPGSLKGQIVDYLQESGRAKSAAQISRAIERNRQSVAQLLRRMEEAGEAESYYDAKWKVRRYKVTNLAILNVQEHREAEKQAEKNGDLLFEYLADGNTLEGELDFGIAAKELDLKIIDVKLAARFMFERGVFNREYVGGEPHYGLSMGIVS